MSPLHIAIVMEGDRPWVALSRMVRDARRARVRVVTAYAFSEDVWRLPPHDVERAMKQCERAARGELRALGLEGVRMRLSGRSDRLPDMVRSALDALITETADNDELVLNLVIDYRECALASKLYTAGLPDPDTVIRTGGERLSSFLLYGARRYGT